MNILRNRVKDLNCLPEKNRAKNFPKPLVIPVEVWYNIKNNLTGMHLLLLTDGKNEVGDSKVVLVKKAFQAMDSLKTS